MTEKSNLVLFAEKELACLANDDDEMQEVMNRHILEMVRVFSEEKHSGFSAMYAIRILERLLRYLPLSAIEDKPEEWNEVGEGVFQHRRCGKIFKDKEQFDGQAYNIEGRVFSNDNGKTWFTNGKSFLPIDFPYFVPSHPFEYLVDENGEIICEYSRYRR